MQALTVFHDMFVCVCHIVEMPHRSALTEIDVRRRTSRCIEINHVITDLANLRIRYLQLNRRTLLHGYKDRNHIECMYAQCSSLEQLSYETLGCSRLSTYYFVQLDSYSGLYRSMLWNLTS